MTRPTNLLPPFLLVPPSPFFFLPSWNNTFFRVISRGKRSRPASLRPIPLSKKIPRPSTNETLSIRVEKARAKSSYSYSSSLDEDKIPPPSPPPLFVLHTRNASWIFTKRAALHHNSTNDRNYLETIRPINDPGSCAISVRRTVLIATFHTFESSRSRSYYLFFYSFHAALHRERKINKSKIMVARYVLGA